MEREEAGTPAFIGSIRAGLVFQLKAGCGRRYHPKIRASLHTSGHQGLAQNPDIKILGDHDRWRLSIVSFMIRFDEDQFLHHHFVVALLNDLFGIQSRGGWQCAGPYGHRLLEIDAERSQALQKEIVRGCRGVKPGWVRMNFNYFISETVFEYLVEAVLLIAEHGWRMMTDYIFDPETGRWRHHAVEPVARMGLQDISYRSGRMEYRARHAMEPEAALPSYLEEARQIMENNRLEAGRSIDPVPLSADYESLRWFPLPMDVQSKMDDEGRSASR